MVSLSPDFIPLNFQDEWPTKVGGGERGFIHVLSVEGGKKSSDWLIQELGFWAELYKRIMYL